MVMDIRDLLLHDTYFDEFIILSGDADFTPVLIRLRAHARRTVVFANDFTAAPYTAICDGEVREAALIELILAGEAPASAHEEAGSAAAAGKGRIEEVRREILAEVIAGVRASASPVPLEALADRALRALGHERTIATGWAGAGSFSELLRRSLPDDIKLTGDPPYLAFDPKRHQEDRLRRKAPETGTAEAAPGPAAALADTQPATEPATVPTKAEAVPSGDGGQGEGLQPAALRGGALAQAPVVQPPAVPAPQRLEPPSPIQQSIARIQEACQAPPLAPQEYRALFEIMAKEINDHDLRGVETLNSIARQAMERGIDLRRDDIRFVLEVVSEVDPWFEQGASAGLFAGRFRTFVVARCRGQGLNLLADELHLIDAWFLGTGSPQTPAPRSASRATPAIAPPSAPGAVPPTLTLEARDGRWWSPDDGRAHRTGVRETSSGVGQDAEASASASGEFPRLVRTRLRG
jgi:hypothetical protein